MNFLLSETRYVTVGVLKLKIMTEMTKLDWMFVLYEVSIQNSLLHSHTKNRGAHGYDMVWLILPSPPMYTPHTCSESRYSVADQTCPTTALIFSWCVIQKQKDIGSGKKTLVDRRRCTLMDTVCLLIYWCKASKNKHHRFMWSLSLTHHLLFTITPFPICHCVVG